MSQLRLLIAAAFITVSTTNTACAQDIGEESRVEVAGWLAGCWVAGTDDRQTEEQWMAPGGGLMVGMVRSIRDGVARGHEFLLIRQEEDELVFTAYPSGQQPADFAATVTTDTELRFENPTHDFPQKIEYHWMDADRVVAKVYGEVDALEPAFEVDYRRVQCIGTAK